MDKYLIRDNFKLYFKYVMRFFLKIFWIFPIRKNTVFLMANMGKGYLCNPKYIYKSMISDSKFLNYQYIWCFNEPNKIDRENFNENTQIIGKRNYFKFFYYLLTSEIIIYNCGGFSYAPIRKKQFLIETWHGGGAFKKVGLSVDKKSNSSKKGIELAMKDVKLFLSTCEMATNKLIREAMGYHGPVLNSGFPRNDILFENNQDYIYEIKDKLNLKRDEKVIIYAPTFRGDENHAKGFNDKYEIINPNLIKETLSKKFGGVWKFYVRGHQYAQNILLDGADGDLSQYPDMQELLLISDVLITDYSSSIWDYSITNKMSFLYVPDLNEYDTLERGFLTPFVKWPGIKVISNSDFVEKINTYSKESQISKNESFMKWCNGYENGTACLCVKDAILKRDEIIRKGD